MISSLERRRILIFLAFAFGIAWLAGLVIFLTGGLVNSPVIAPGIGLTLAGILLATVYMWAPAFATLLTRVITGEGWANAGLRPFFREGWPYWIAAWVLPAVLTVLGAAFFYLVFPQYFDPQLNTIRTQLETLGQPVMENLWGLILFQLAIAIFIAPIANGLFTFGEEFGWRAYLLPKLLPLGLRRAMLVQGLIWGIWHWPVIAMGYEYGFDYPGFPVTGMLLFLVFTFSSGVFLAWVTLRGRSVWPAVIGHGAINGIAAIAVLFTQGTPPALLGPLPVGLLGVGGYLLFALLLVLRQGSLEPAVPTSLQLPGQEGAAPESPEQESLGPEGPEPSA